MNVLPLSLLVRPLRIGAVIVSTPQDVSMSDVRKGIAMFRKVSIPVCFILKCLLTVMMLIQLPLLVDYGHCIEYILL